jgi:hypothetical protein
MYIMWNNDFPQANYFTSTVTHSSNSQEEILEFLDSILSKILIYFMSLFVFFITPQSSRQPTDSEEVG